MHVHGRKYASDRLRCFARFQFTERVAKVQEKFLVPLHAVSAEQSSVPGQISVVADLAPRNVEKPSSWMATIEPAQAAARHQKDLLDEIVMVRWSSAEGSNPPCNVWLPVAIQVLEGECLSVGDFHGLTSLNGRNSQQWPDFFAASTNGARSAIRSWPCVPPPSAARRCLRAGLFRSRQTSSRW